MKFATTTLLLFLCISISFCQYNLVADEFTSSNEIKLLEKYSNTTAFDLLYEVDHVTDETRIKIEKDALYKFLDEVKTKTTSKKFKKNASTIFKLIHNKYFRKYVDNPNFGDIFKNGNYNCVTATALYAIALDYLNIDYEIREMPTHVYLIVNPENERIFYETTTPGINPFQINARKLQLYKQYLVTNKMMTEAEARNDEYFNKNWLEDEVINLKQLIALQYHNNAIKYYDEEDFDKAVIQAGKASQFYDKDYIKDFLYGNVVELLNNNIGNQSSEELCNYLSKIYDYKKDKDNFNNQFIENFNYYTNHFLKNSEGIAEYESLHKCIIETLKDEAIIENINNEFNNNLTVYYYNAAQFEKALNHIEKSYLPGNKDFNLLIVNSITQNYQHNNDAELCLNQLSNYQQTFPFLSENATFKTLKIYNYMKLVYEKFELDNEVSALSYLNQFRKEYPANNGDDYNHQHITMGYAAVIDHYVNNSDFKKAYTLLDEGFAYTPNNIKLKRLEREIVNFKIRTEVGK